MSTPSEVPPKKGPDSVPAARPVEPERIAAPGTSFESYVQRAETPGIASAGQGALPNPMEMNRVAALPTGKPTVESLTTQAKAAQDALGVVQQQLQTPNLKLKRSQAHLLRNKLVDAQGYARTAAEKLGVETAPMNPPSEGGPIERFLAYVNDGQNQFNAVQKKLKDMAASSQQISPGEMMLLQSKLSVAQQEIEYASVLLSRVISSITTLMSIQL